MVETQHRELDEADAEAAIQRRDRRADDQPGDAANDEDDGDDGDDDDGDGDDSDDYDDYDAHNFLLDEDSDAPNLVPEEHARGILAGKYEMLDKIGEGGMGAVWRGHHLKLDRAVAIKVLDETLQLRADGRERFIREAKALALLEHRNVVRIHDCDQLPDGKLYLCMELLDGETLRAMIKGGVRPDPIEVCDIGLQICDALEAAHKRGILHRDLTPSNIMRLRDPARTIKVIDWGLCKYLDLFYMRSPPKYGAPPGSRLVTPLGCRFGTPEYMAPEMILRENPGPPSYCTDVYALGVVLYELLTGRQPFAFGDRQRPRPIETFLPGFTFDDLETALRGALRYDPEERTPNIAELREALDMARECILAQRAGSAAARIERDGSMPTPVAALPRAPSEAAPVLSCSPPVVVEGDATRPRALPVPVPTLPAPPRGRLAVVLAALVGAAAGAGGILVMQGLDSATSVVDVASPAIAATLAREADRARATELKAAYCEAGAARREPVVNATASPPPPSPPAKDKADARGRLAVLAAVTDPGPPPTSSSEPRSPSRPPSASPRPTAPIATFEQAMARLEPKIRGCAREAGVPETSTTVRVRRKDGAVDMVKVVKLSSEHPFAVCVNGVIRHASLPPSTGSVEDFTFLK